MLELVSTLSLTPFPWHHRAADPCPVVLSRRVRYGTVQAPRCGCGLSLLHSSCQLVFRRCLLSPGRFLPSPPLRSGLSWARGRHPTHGHLNIQQFSLLPLGLLRGILRAHIAADLLWHSAGLLSQHYKYFNPQQHSSHAPRPPVSPSLPPCCCNLPPWSRFVD